MSCVPYLQTVRLAWALLLLIPGVGVGQDQISDAALEHAKELLRSTPLIDGHNDLPWLIREETGGDVAAFRHIYAVVDSASQDKLSVKRLMPPNWTVRYWP